MRQEHKDYDDGHVPPERTIPEWLHVPIAFLLISCGVLVIAKAIGMVFAAD